MAASDKQTEWQGIALVIVGAFCFSLAIPFVRWTHDLNTQTIAFFRALFALIFLSSLLRWFPQPLHVASYRPWIPQIMLLSLMVASTVTLYTYAVKHTTAANAVLLVNSAPVYVAVLAPLVVGEPRARHTWISLLLAISGMVMMSNPSQLEFSVESLGGIVAAALSGLTYGLVMLTSRALRDRVTGLTQNLWSNATITLLLLPWAVQTPAADIVSNLPILIPLGIFSLGLSYLFYFLGLQRISTQMVSVVALFEPMFGVLIGVFLFAEIPNLLGWAGAGLILFSIFLISR